MITARLAEAANSPWHRFWYDDLSLLEPSRVDWRHVLGSRQVTDVYRLALAVRHGGRLVAFDRAVPIGAVAGAGQTHLEVI